VDTSPVAAASPEIEAFLADAPKVELHLHLVGSASAATLTELADRHPDVGVPRGAADLATFFEFRDFPHFIDVYSTVNDLVRTPADVSTLLVRAAEDLASHQVRYAEVTVTPVMHEMRGLPHEGLLDGLDDGRRLAAALGVELAWIYDIPGEHGQPAAERTLRLALDQPPDGLVGVTINTDDPHMFGTDLSEEYRRLSRAFGFGVPELARLVVHGIEASFLPADRQRRLVAEVARVAAGR
jgi:aminodeoxyfutalosine deaminase